MFQQIIVAAGLAVLSGFAGAFEAALLSLSRSRLEELVDEPGADTGIGKLVFIRSIVAGKQSIRLAVTLLHAFSLGGFLFYSWMALVRPALERSLRESGTLFSWQAVGLIALLLLIAGKVRAIAIFFGGVNEERLVLNGARVAWLMTLPLYPLAWMLLHLTQGLARGLGHRTNMSDEERLEEREDEVIAAVSDGELDGVVEEDQREMIEGIIELKDFDVADVFTPRTEMISISDENSVTDAIAVSLEKGFSRLPVHHETRDNIIGIFFARDALEFWGQPGESVPKLSELCRKPLFVPETKKVSELLRQMRELHTHMAIVLDEYGGTAGLVTIEDVIEEIVGDINDEYDDVTMSTEPIRHFDENTIISEASVHVHDINEAFDIDTVPEDDDYETLGGFVLDQLGHIPQAGETFEYEALKLEVLSADQRRVGTVKITFDPNWEEE